MAHVSEEKKQIVKELVDLFTKYNVIGMVDLANLPAKQLQTMRDKLRETVTLKMAKKRLIRKAMEEIKGKKDLSGLEPHIKGMAAVMFTNENPFKLYKILEKNKSSAPAKAGQEAPKDIVVKSGKTSFAPGPIISELASVGIKTKVDGGKLAITDDVVVAKEGEEISAKLASLLTRLGIEPMEIGLNLTGIYENGDILTKDVLDVDESKYEQDIITAYKWSLNLAVEAEIFTAESTDMILGKAFRASKALSLESGFITDATAVDLLAKAERQASSLKSELNV